MTDVICQMFDSSMMVHFRKCFPIEFVTKVIEYICTWKWPEEMRDVDWNDNGLGAGYGGSRNWFLRQLNTHNSVQLICFYSLVIKYWLYMICIVRKKLHEEICVIFWLLDIFCYGLRTIIVFQVIVEVLIRIVLPLKHGKSLYACVNPKRR